MLFWESTHSKYQLSYLWVFEEEPGNGIVEFTSDCWFLRECPSNNCLKTQCHATINWNEWLKVYLQTAVLISPIISTKSHILSRNPPNLQFVSVSYTLGWQHMLKNVIWLYVHAASLICLVFTILKKKATGEKNTKLYLTQYPLMDRNGHLPSLWWTSILCPINNIH